jgi:hypothetical protein
MVWADGQLLVEQGHYVVLYARNLARADDIRRALPQTEPVILGDLSTIAGARNTAEQVSRIGRYDAAIHNVGVGYRESRHIETEDGFPLCSQPPDRQVSCNGAKLVFYACPPPAKDRKCNPCVPYSHPPGRARCGLPASGKEKSPAPAKRRGK